MIVILSFWVFLMESKLLNYAKSLWTHNPFIREHTVHIQAVSYFDDRLELHRSEVLSIANHNSAPQDSCATVNDITSKDIQYLIDLRSNVSNKICDIQKLPVGPERNKAVEDLYLYSAGQMKQLLATMYHESEQLITSPPPCKYCVFAVGSMALNQSTAFSDYEFGILTENDYYLSDPLTCNYFRDLSRLVELRVINLGETVINKNDIGGAHVYHLIKRGVSLDLGGKTPIQTDPTKPELVQTVEGTLDILRNVDKNPSWVDTSYILEATCFVHGDQALNDEFRRKADEFLRLPSSEIQYPGLLNHQVRALRRLKDGVNIEESRLNSAITGAPGDGNLDQFAPRLAGRAEEGRVFNVKQNIYRLPDRLIYNLALLHGVFAASAWEAVSQLNDTGKEVLNPSAAENIQNAVSFATLLRATTYAAHGCQCDDLDIFDNAGGVFALTEADCGPDGQLFQYFYIALPLHAELAKLVETVTVGKGGVDFSLLSTFFKNTELYDSRAFTRGHVSLRLARYEEATEFLREALTDAALITDPVERSAELISIHKVLGRIHSLLGDHQQGLMSYQAIIDSVLLRRGVALSAEDAFEEYPVDPDIAGPLSNMGLIYNLQGEFKRALKCTKRAYEISLQLHYNPSAEEQFRSDHPDTAGYTVNLAVTFHYMGQYAEAIRLYWLSIEMYKRLNHRGEHDSTIATMMSNVACSMKEQGDLIGSLALYKKSLGKVVEFYGTFHDEVFRVQNNIGLILHIQREYRQATDIFEECIRQQEIYFRGGKNPLLVATLNNAANAYKGLADYETAFARYNQSLEYQKEVYKGTDHEHTIITLANLGALCRTLGRAEDALRYYSSSVEKAERFYRQIGHHSEWALSLTGVAHAHSMMNQFDLAIEYFDHAIVMFKQVHKGSEHTDQADCLDNKGIAYERSFKFLESVECLKESLAMRLRILRKGNAENRSLLSEDDVMFHPSLGFTYLNLANAYTSAKKYDLSYTFHLMGLKVRRRQYGEGVDHADMARSLNNIGVNFRLQGQLELALKNIIEGLEMRRRVYATRPASDVKHNETASSLFNLALVYEDSKQFTRAAQILQECVAVQIAVSSSSPQHYAKIGVTLDHLGNLFTNHLDDELSALRCYTDCLKYRKLAHPSRVHIEIVKTLEDIARIQKQALQDYHSSVTSYNQACDVIRALSVYPQQSFDLAKNMTEAAECYVRLNDLSNAARQCDEVMSLCETQSGPAFRQLSGLASEWSGGIHRALGFTALDIHEYAVGIHQFELSLKHTPLSQVGLHQALTHQMGNMHHILITQLRAQDPQDSARIAHHEKKGEECFRKACELKTSGNIAGGVGTFTECANFLIEINKHTDALSYLLQAISLESNDNESCGMLGYDAHEKLCITPALRECLNTILASDSTGSVSINAKELAYNLLILHASVFGLSTSVVEQYREAFGVMIEENGSEVGVCLFSQL